MIVEETEELTGGYASMLDQVPVVGFGTSRLYREVATEAVVHAVRCGARHIDTAKVRKEEVVQRGNKKERSGNF